MNTNLLSTIPTSTPDSLNSTLIDILRGAKDVGGEIYGASKIAIMKSVDFVSEQAPQVVTEFLNWKFYEALIVLIPCLVLLAGLVWWCIFFARYGSKYKWDFGNRESLIPLSFITGCLLFIVGGFASEAAIDKLKTVIQIKVAPRVYLIEYVVDAAKGEKK